MSVAVSPQVLYRCGGPGTAPLLSSCHAHDGHTDSQGSRMMSRIFSVRARLATFVKFCAEILAAASDGVLDIEDITGVSVLQKTFKPSLLVPFYFKATKSCFPRLIRLLLRCDN
uniref:Uncharacterized protein n=1 Tax=Quercus lobata TaxID=97700 RepID=A0A7N2LVQ9_QUELO